MKRYTIQLSQKISISREIKANSIEEALEIANGYRLEAVEEALVKPAKKPWQYEWTDEEAEIIGVFG